jgi:hypothetical protein
MTRTAPRVAASTTGHLVLGTLPTPLAFPASDVLDISRAGASTSETTPLDSLVPVDFSTSEPEWVIRVGNHTRSMATLVRGSVRLEYVTSSALIPMPSVDYSGTRLFSYVIMVDGRPFALVVKVDALLQAHRELTK